MSHAAPTPPDVTPTIPPQARTWAYAVGTVLGIGVAPALLAVGQTEAAGVAAALAGAANALAFGYRPTRAADG